MNYWNSSTTFQFNSPVLAFFFCIFFFFPEPFHRSKSSSRQRVGPKYHNSSEIVFAALATKDKLACRFLWMSLNFRKPMVDWMKSFPKISIGNFKKIYQEYPQSHLGHTNKRLWRRVDIIQMSSLWPNMI